MILLHRESDEIRYTGFDEAHTPPYAILSHTWGPDEVTFKDIRKNRGKSKAGFKKIEFCMQQAIADGLHHCWVDTCCIDQANNNDVSEAINSMFRWYRDAVKCYVYLSDVPEKNFQSSRWFTRGWTLQELLAPRLVEFFDSDGKRIGDKISLLQDIHVRTQIPIAALQGHNLDQFSVKEKMGWIEQRETKRDEDMVYSLLGIFGVSMPLVYGERREKALFRLHEQIEKNRTFTEFSHRLNLDNVAQVKKMQPSPPPAFDQPQSGRSLTIPALLHYLVVQSRSLQTSNADGWEQAVEREIGVKRSQIQPLIHQSQSTCGTSSPKLKFKCQTCERRFYSQPAADQHMNDTNHWGPKFKCQTCEKKFFNQLAADQHMDATRHWKPKFKCQTCERRFHDRTSAHQHMHDTNH